MVGPSNLKKLKKLFSLKLPYSSSSYSYSSSSSSTMKLKTLIQTLLFSHVRRALRSLSAAKLKADRTLQVLIYSPTKKLKGPKRHRKAKNDITKNFFGSFRFHYNWCSSKRHSHVLPVPSPVYDGLGGSHLYYDSTWHSVVPTPGQHGHEPDGHGSNTESQELYGYLQWLEEKKVHGKPYGGVADHDGDGDGNPTAENNDDIDTLADLFIASCHAKFILEKQESARRFKEMLERSA